MEFRKAIKNDIQELKNISREVIFNNYVSFLGIDKVRQFVESGEADKEMEDGIDNCFVMIKCYRKRVVGG